MPILKMIPMIFMAAALAACGSGDVVSGNDNGNNSGGSGSVLIIPSLGNGSGKDFVEGAIGTDSYAVVAGGSLDLSVSVVNKQAANALVSEEYLYAFSSNCPDGSVDFTVKETNSSGVVGTVFRNINCTGDRTITAQIFTKGANAQRASALSTATLKIEAALPLLGTGQGTEFSNGIINGAETVESGEGLELSANAVNPLTSNSAINGDNYIATWSSSCATATFTPAKQDLKNSDIKTKYQSGCAGGSTDTVTLTLTNREGAVQAQTTKDISITTGVIPRLGNGFGAGYTDGVLNVDPVTLSYGGTALIVANIVDGNNTNALIQSRAYAVTIESTCESQGRSEFTSKQVITFVGEARFSYQAKNCDGNDTIKASLYPVVNGVANQATALATATGTLTILKQEIGGISFKEATAQQIALSSIANSILPQQSKVTFFVFNKNGDPVADQKVNFSLTTKAGGVALTSADGVTNTAGEVSALVNSGTAQASVSVQATTTLPDGTVLTTNSLPIAITTGIPSQDRFSISAETLNPGAFNVDGVEVSINVVAADVLGNPAPDGTVVNFTAESGAIGETCLTTAGRCSVTWVSGGKRPGQFDTALRVNEHIGITTILAYTEGEASFTDVNGNGVFDAGEPYNHYGEAFRDDNWNHRNNWSVATNAQPESPKEIFIDYDQNGIYANANAAGTYQGALCSDAAKGAGHCGSLMHVRDQLRLVQSVSDVVRMRIFTSLDGINFTEENLSAFSLTPAGGSFYVLLQDSNYNMAASGTTLNVKGDGYKIFGGTQPVRNSIGELSVEGISLVPATNVTYGQLFPITYAPDGVLVNIEVSATVDGNSTAPIILK